jgi:hypothetical protein
MYTWSFPGVKRPVRGVHHPPQFIADVRERVEIYLYSPSGPPWPVLGWTLPCNTSVYQLCLCSHFRTHVGLFEFLKQLAGLQKELTEIYETERERERENWKGHCYNPDPMEPRFTNSIRSWRPFVTRNVRKPKLCILSKSYTATDALPPILPVCRQPLLPACVFVTWDPVRHPRLFFRKICSWTDLLVMRGFREPRFHCISSVVECVCACARACVASAW